MSKFLGTFVLVLLVLGVVSKAAAEREFADIYEECGLGAMIAPKNPAVAAVTNVTWDSGTTAISSNISSPDTCGGGKEKTAAFIHDSYKALENDLASGEGTYLDTLMTLSGIHESSKLKFVQALRSDFAKIVAEPGYSVQSQFEHAQALYNLVYKHSAAISS